MGKRIGCGWRWERQRRDSTLYPWEKGKVARGWEGSAAEDDRDAVRTAANSYRSRVSVRRDVTCNVRSLLYTNNATAPAYGKICEESTRETIAMKGQVTINKDPRCVWVPQRVCKI